MIAAVDSANAPKELIAGENFTRGHQHVDPARPADEQLALRDVVA